MTLQVTLRKVRYSIRYQGPSTTTLINWIDHLRFLRVRARRDGNDGGEFDRQTNDNLLFSSLMILPRYHRTDRWWSGRDPFMPELLEFWNIIGWKIRAGSY